jgi:hypothetical protein
MLPSSGGIAGTSQSGECRTRNAARVFDISRTKAARLWQSALPDTCLVYHCTVCFA